MTSLDTKRLLWSDTEWEALHTLDMYIEALFHPDASRVDAIKEASIRLGLKAIRVNMRLEPRNTYFSPTGTKQAAADRVKRAVQSCMLLEMLLMWQFRSDTERFDALKTLDTNMCMSLLRSLGLILPTFKRRALSDMLDDAACLELLTHCSRMPDEKYTSLDAMLADLTHIVDATPNEAEAFILHTGPQFLAHPLQDLPTVVLLEPASLAHFQAMRMRAMQQGLGPSSLLLYPGSMPFCPLINSGTSSETGKHTSNNCFINSFLQCIFHLPEMRHMLLNVQVHAQEEDPLLYLMQRVAFHQFVTEDRAALQAHSLQLSIAIRERLQCYDPDLAGTNTYTGQATLLTLLGSFQNFSQGTHLLNILFTYLTKRRVGKRYPLPELMYDSGRPSINHVEERVAYGALPDAWKLLPMVGHVHSRFFQTRIDVKDAWKVSHLSIELMALDRPVSILDDEPSLSEWCLCMPEAYVEPPPYLLVYPFHQHYGNMASMAVPFQKSGKWETDVSNRVPNKAVIERDITDTIQHIDLASIADVCNRTGNKDQLFATMLRKLIGRYTTLNQSNVASMLEHLENPSYTLSQMEVACMKLFVMGDENRLGIINILFQLLHCKEHKLTIKCVPYVPSMQGSMVFNIEWTCSDTSIPVVTAPLVSAPEHEVPQYTLFAEALHTGSESGGHYIARVVGQDKRVYTVNDLRNEVSDGEVYQPAIKSVVQIYKLDTTPP